MLPYILGFTAFAVVVGLVLELFNGRNHKLGLTATITAILMVLVNGATIYFFMPSFSHVLSGGWFFLSLANLFMPALISSGVGYDEYEDSYTGGQVGVTIGMIVLVLYGVLAAMTPPVFCNTGQIRERIGLLELQEATSPYPNTDLGSMIRVPASVALSKAGNTLSSGEYSALGNYLQPNRAYIQRVQGRPYYVIDLKVTNWVAYRQAGKVIPGYLLVDANDENAPVEFRLGYSLVYAPQAQWDMDLDRYVYRKFLLGSPYQIRDLDGMEVDDNFVPTYTGSVMAHVIGYQGTKVAGLYTVDPQTGVDASLSLDQKPEWMDRVYPLEWVKTQISLWGSFAHHEACSWTNVGQVQVDSWNDVTIPGGLEYQFTMTGMGDDPSLTHIITVNPTTGVGTVYAAQGKTIEGIKAMVEQRSKLLNPAGYVADECEIHGILNANTAYCILTFQNGADYSIGGYAFVDLELAMNNNLEDIAVATTFDEAYQQYQAVKARVSGDTQLSNTQNDLQAIGTVQSNVHVNYGGEAGSYLMNVKTYDGQSLWLLARGTSLNAAAAQSGTRVTVTYYAQEGQNYFTVRYVRVEGVPDLDG